MWNKSVSQATSPLRRLSSTVAGAPEALPDKLVLPSSACRPPSSNFQISFVGAVTTPLAAGVAPPSLILSWSETDESSDGSTFDSLREAGLTSSPSACSSRFLLPSMAADRSAQQTGVSLETAAPGASETDEPMRLKGSTLNGLRDTALTSSPSARRFLPPSMAMSSIAAGRSALPTRAAVSAAADITVCCC